MKQVAGLHFVHHGAIRMFVSRHAFDRMMKVRIERLANRLNTRQPLFRQNVAKLAPNEIESLAIFRAGRIALPGERAIKRVEHGKEIFDQEFHAAMALLLALTLDALSIIVKIRLAAKQRVQEFLLLGDKFPDFIKSTGRRRIGDLKDRFRLRCDGLGVMTFVFMMRAHEDLFSSEFSEKN